jgi:hypothetical protein
MMSTTFGGDANRPKGMKQSKKSRKNIPANSLLKNLSSWVMRTTLHV